MFDTLGLSPAHSIDELEVLKKQRKDRERAMAEIADAIITLTSMPEWEVVEGYLREEKKLYNRHPYYYSKNPNASHMDSGALFVLESLESWIQECKDFNKEKSYDEQQ